MSHSTLQFLLQFFCVAVHSLRVLESTFGPGDVLQSLSESISQGFSNRRHLAGNCSCAFHACSNLLDHNTVCSERLGSLDMCGSECTTRKLALNFSIVTTPPEADPDNWSPLVAEDVCIYQTLNDAFLNLESTIYSWVYFGTAGGVSIVYPGAASGRGVTDGPSDEKLGHCEQYDPRVRPWYMDAASAPKDIIILIDASRSMVSVAGPTTITTRWDMAKDVAKTVIDLLHFADAVTVMILGDQYFNETSEPTLHEASDENKAMLKEMLDRVEPSGSKMTLRGLEAAFLTLRRAQSEQIKTTRCQQVILWISDGQLCSNPSGSRCVDQEEVDAANKLNKQRHNHADHDDHDDHTKHDDHDDHSDHADHDGHDDHDDPEDKGHASHDHSAGGTEHAYLHQFLSFLQNEQATLKPTSVHGRASIFVATVSDGADSKLPRHVACNNNGTWMPIKHGRDIIEQLTPFQSFFAVQKKESDVFWSRFYEDFSGLGLMTTATRPMFSLGDDGPRRGRLLGVLGYDIPLRHLIDNGLRYEEIVGQLTKNIGQCNVHHIDNCQLQILREEKGECPNIYPIAQCYQNALTGRVYYTTNTVTDHWTYDEAVASCIALGGVLAEVHSSQEQSMISGIAAVDGSWIALSKSNTTNQWEWMSGIERGIDSGSGFWAKKTITEFGKRYCAAIDSRGTRKNVDVRNCEDGLHMLCEFRSVEEAKACKGDIHVVEVNAVTERPSLKHCLKDYHPSIHINSADFFELRRQENSNPVFCPLALDNPQPSTEALCCKSCLAVNTSSLEDDSEMPSVDDISAARTERATSVLFVCLFVAFLIF